MGDKGGKKDKEKSKKQKANAQAKKAKKQGNSGGNLLHENGGLRLDEAH